MLCTSKEVIIVPGYGLAAALGQYPMAELVKTLSENNMKESFAIHPDAGRKTGIMNVLLA